jgi:arylsulfatase A-like enzyme
VSYSQPVGNDPTGRQNPELLKVKLSQGHDQTIVNGISRIGYMSGGKAARWVDEDMADTITRKAVQFIERSKDKPFFLYFATHDIHVPRVPHQRFKSGSQCGVRGDVVQEFDWSVGEIVSALDRLGLADNTLLIVTSDNGPVVDDGYADGATEDLKGHTPAGPLRGGKYSFYEGGTREPFIVRWPGRVKPGVSDALIGQWDLLASFAALTGQTLATEAGPDSFNVLPALLGEFKQGRDHLVEHANRLAIRKGQWKLVSAGGAAPAKAAAKAKAKAGAKAASAGPELYDLAADIGEKNNVAAQNPDVVKELTALLDQIREKGRSRP